MNFIRKNCVIVLLYAYADMCNVNVQVEVDSVLKNTYTQFSPFFKSKFEFL